METKIAKKLPVEGIQTESGSQDKPISEQSRLTIDEMETESTGPLDRTIIRQMESCIRCDIGYIFHMLQICEWVKDINAVYI